MDYQIYPVEVPIKDHGKPGIIAVKSKELDNLNRIDFKKHENNDHTYKQCNIRYESREDLEHHKRIRHRQYNDEQINNYQENRRQLRNQTDRINLKKSKDNLDCRHDIEKQNNENNRYQYKCDLCNKSFESRNDAIDHENKDECDQCGKWLGYETCVEKHTDKEHENRGLRIEPHRETQTLYIGPPNFYNENYSEEELKTNKDNNGKIFERIDETDEENKRIIEKMKNELGAKNSGNQAVCADTNDNPYNNKMRLELPKDATHDGTNIDLAVTISYGDNSIIRTVKNYY